MKFLCDRCKTRYSIGDERVRGKILKIRCKNCANVITVREGMAADPDAAPPEAVARPKKVTTVAPVALEELSAAGSEGAPVTQKLGPGSEGAPVTQKLGPAGEGAPVTQKLGPAGEGAPVALKLGPAGEGGPVALKLGRPGDGGPVALKLGRPGDGGPVALKLGRPGDDAPVTQKLGRPGDRGEPDAASRAGGMRDPAAALNRGGAPAVAASPALAAASRCAGAREPAATRDADGAAQPRRGAQADAARGPGGAVRGGAEPPRGEPVNALNAAFASAMAQPPPALEEEWYVSIDGEQAGPFSLADAQRWVAQQPPDAELHCWSEGFDDWLPVDKVSHFRGLRSRPTLPSAPPPLPRAGVPPRAAAPAPAPGPSEDEPKPLFAATMASLERGAPAIPTTRPGLPPPVAPARTPPPLGNALQPRGNPGQNGVHGAAIAPLEARPEVKTEAKIEERIDAKPEAKIEAKIDAKPEARSASPAAMPRFPIADPFDMSEGGDGATQLEAMPFEEAPTVGRDPPPSASDAGLTAPQLPGAGMLRGTGASAAATRAAASDFGSGDDLDIGEVSRVVNLADISRAPRTDGRPGTPRPGSVLRARTTGANPAVHPGGRSTGAVPSLPAAGEPGADGDPALAMAPVVRAHRRGLIALLAVAGAVVLAVVGAVIVFMAREDDTPTSGSLGEVHDIDTSRPEDPVVHRAIGSAAAPAPVPAPPRPVSRPRPTPGITAGSQVAEVPTGGLAGDEIEDVARKHQDMTQRCYMRSQRGADAILIGDVKKIAVTLTIDRDGNVSELQLSQHAADTLGKCLSTAIKGWKFRPSAGGIYRFSLAFASG